jgi:hypothetical protein
MEFHIDLIPVARPIYMFPYRLWWPCQEELKKLLDYCYPKVLVDLVSHLREHPFSYNQEVCGLLCSKHRNNQEEKMHCLTSRTCVMSWTELCSPRLISSLAIMEWKHDIEKIASSIRYGNYENRVVFWTSECNFMRATDHIVHMFLTSW